MRLAGLSIYGCCCCLFIIVLRLFTGVGLRLGGVLLVGVAQ